MDIGNTFSLKDAYIRDKYKIYGIKGLNKGRYIEYNAI